MRIVELSDYTMTVMKDSEDPFWFGISKLQSRISDKHFNVAVVLEEEMGSFPQIPKHFVVPEDSICTAGRLVLYFADKIPKVYKVGSRVDFWILR